MRSVIANTEESRHRLDTLGAFMFKYSDDNGHTWSKERYENPYKGQVMFFWSVSKPILYKILY
ncbi:MAG TPA: hypothetical protein GXX36_12925 [Clostridiaceae bacterium]|nr:hypothetical protein [Clostridiaceae bacterium]